MTKQDAPTKTDAERAAFEAEFSARPYYLSMTWSYVRDAYEDKETRYAYAGYKAGASSQAARASSAAAQPGWKLVPMESTPEMDEAGFNHVYPPTNHNDCAYVWEAMVKAAPPAPPAKPADTGEAP